MKTDTPNRGAMSQIQYERSVSNRTRFAVLHRDHHTCQYCGRCAPYVSLVVDHVIPLAQGGTNEIDNLITACKDCNQGKADFIITSDGDLIPNIGRQFRKYMVRLHSYDLFGNSIVEFKRHADLNVDEWRQVIAGLIADVSKIVTTACVYRDVAYKRFGVKIPLFFDLPDQAKKANK